MTRFYLSNSCVKGQVFDLPKEIAHHVRVLRLKVGDTIVVFDGEGDEFITQIRLFDRTRIEVEILTRFVQNRELPYAINLVQALPEGTKMDWIVEKIVELGVSYIQPLQAQRCVVRLNTLRAEKKRIHWQKIIIAACEQSGRNRLARLGEVQRFEDWVTQSDIHKRIMLSPRAEQSLSDWVRHHPSQTLSIMIGPEGGFSETEEKEALRQGVLALSMGPRILRTETAGLAALASINALWSEMPQY